MNQCLNNSNVDSSVLYSKFNFLANFLNCWYVNWGHLWYSVKRVFVRYREARL